MALKRVQACISRLHCRAMPIQRTCTHVIHVMRGRGLGNEIFQCLFFWGLRSHIRAERHFLQRERGRNRTLEQLGALSGGGAHVSPIVPDEHDLALNT